MRTGEAASLFGHLFWPERRPVSEAERDLAAERISRACAEGMITEEQARQRKARLPAAVTRGDLRVALTGLPGALAPAGLLAAGRIAFVVWTVVNLAQLYVWAMVGLVTGYWDTPWWLWTVVVGAPFVGGLWWTIEWEHRMRLSEWVDAGVTR